MTLWKNGVIRTSNEKSEKNSDGEHFMFRDEFVVEKIMNADDNAQFKQITHRMRRLFRG